MSTNENSEAKLTEWADQAEDILSQILELMEVEADIEVIMPEENNEGDPIILNIEGEDAGLLIGRRGSTLRDLQSIVTTVVSRSIGEFVALRVDVENYQQRKLDQIREVAERAANHVIDRRRPITLEPMSPAERRIVHTTLQDYPELNTESFGRGPARRVTISLINDSSSDPDEEEYDEILDDEYDDDDYDDDYDEEEE